MALRIDSDTQLDISSAGVQLHHDRNMYFQWLRLIFQFGQICEIVEKDSPKATQSPYPEKSIVRFCPFQLFDRLKHAVPMILQHVERTGCTSGAAGK